MAYSLQGQPSHEVDSNYDQWSAVISGLPSLSLADSTQHVDTSTASDQ